jgi:3-deoxy-D-manno-octulosonate 8-phosphate phosphatase (KDO 8-P phosphatase)
MTLDFLETQAQELQARAKSIRLVCFDVDGTLTDGRLYFDSEGRESKAFHVHDGQGLRLLEDNGIAVAIITARDSASAKARAKDLRLSHVFIGVKDKAACLRSLCEQLNITPKQVAYMGDDIPDLPAMKLCALACIPSNAHAWMFDHADWVIPKNAGEGAARMLCDLILEAQNLVPAIVQSGAR